MDFTSIYAILHMDPAVASAVLEGLPKRVEKALDKRVGKTEKYREVLAKVLANLWHQNAFATWDKAKAETALTVLCPLLLCNQVLPKINYKTVADMAEDILAKAEEKETKEKKKWEENKSQSSKDKPRGKSRKRSRSGSPRHRNGNRRERSSSNSAQGQQDRRRRNEKRPSQEGAVDGSQTPRAKRYHQEEDNDARTPRASSAQSLSATSLAPSDQDSATNCPKGRLADIRKEQSMLRQEIANKMEQRGGGRKTGSGSRTKRNCKRQSRGR